MKFFIIFIDFLAKQHCKSYFCIVKEAEKRWFLSETNENHAKRKPDLNLFQCLRRKTATTQRWATCYGEIHFLFSQQKPDIFDGIIKVLEEPFQRPVADFQRGRIWRGRCGRRSHAKDGQETSKDKSYSSIPNEVAPTKIEVRGGDGDNWRGWGQEKGTGEDMVKERY